MRLSGRCSGILLPISALPSPYGIGTLGKAAFHFADFLYQSGQRVWQLLPLGPTGYGDSPYQSFSCFAGNPYLIDLDSLIAQELLRPSEIRSIDWGSRADCVDYARLYASRRAILRLAFQRAQRVPALMAAVEAFRCKNSRWLENYALFMALKHRFNTAPWDSWPEELRVKSPAALDAYSKLLRDDIALEYFIQYTFFTQFHTLHRYCRRKGIALTGDLPIYAAFDSADVWSEPEEFLLDSEQNPLAVAGVPPDDFCPTGQRWGNPLYDWEYMCKDDFTWWRRRIAAAAALYEMIRLDHFRGFESFWSIPPDSRTAESGQWRLGPGLFFIHMLQKYFPDTLFIAEDLGMITDEVHSLRHAAGIPGMAVLSFAFAPGSESPYLPHRLTADCVCCTGTHDNAPLSAFCSSADADTLDYLRSYCGEDLPFSIIRAGMTSPAGIFIAQMQDWLELGEQSRTNTPGAVNGCWQWRLSPGLLTKELQEKIYQLTKAAHRLNSPIYKEDMI